MLMTPLLSLMYSVLNYIDNEASNVFDWFSSNNLKANSGKLNPKKQLSKKILDALIDNKHNFIEHVSKLGRKVIQSNSCSSTNLILHIHKQIKTFHECFLFVKVWVGPSFQNV